MFWTTITTTRGQRYIEQMCGHFRQSDAMQQANSKARITLSFGSCDLIAGDTELRVHVQGPAETMEKFKDVIGSHLERFAFRDAAIVTWHLADQPNNKSGE